MASAPSDPKPVLGRVDRSGRLVSADPELASLQTEAGSRVGAELALPQIAAIARLALKLGVPVVRPAVAAGAEQDIDMLVRATPDGDEVALSLERWSFRAPAPARLADLVPHDRAADAGTAPDEWASDEDLRILSVSAGLAEKLGVAPNDVVGEPLTRLFRLEEDENGALPLLSAVASRSDFEGQRARSRRDEELLLLLSGSVVRSADGKFSGFRGEAVAERGAKVADGKHDLDPILDDTLRTPLDRIIESADRIVQQTDGPLRSDYADYASDIAAAARHLLSVIRSMGSQQAGDQDRIDLARLATDAAVMLAQTAESRDIAIVVAPSAPLMARGEPRGVIQILVNLLGNAVRHSPDRASVAVSFEISDGAARVHVADKGSGIDPADHQRIFERFAQANPQAGGSGLGLAIARRLARSMGGDIWLKSAPGEGSRFTLVLPNA